MRWIVGEQSDLKKRTEKTREEMEKDSALNAEPLRDASTPMEPHACPSNLTKWVQLPVANRMNARMPTHASIGLSRLWTTGEHSGKRSIQLSSVTLQGLGFRGTVNELVHILPC